MTHHHQLDAECCEAIELHEELIHSVSERMPPEEMLYDLSELFKVFGDSMQFYFHCIPHNIRQIFLQWK